MASTAARKPCITEKSADCGLFGGIPTIAIAFMTCVKFCVDCAHVLTMCALASLTMNRICLGKTNQSTLKTKFVTFDLAKIATIPVFQRETDPTQCDNIPLMSPRMLSRGSAIHNNRVQHYNLLLLTFPYLWNFDRRIEDFIIDRIQFK